MVYLFEMVIFHSYVSLPEDTPQKWWLSSWLRYINRSPKGFGTIPWAPEISPMWERVRLLPLLQHASTLTASNNFKLLLSDGGYVYMCTIIICINNIIIIHIDSYCYYYCCYYYHTNNGYNNNHQVSQCAHGFSELPNWWTARGQSQNLRHSRSISAAKMNDHASNIINIVVLSLPPRFQMLLMCTMSAHVCFPYLTCVHLHKINSNILTGLDTSGSDEVSQSRPCH